MLLSGPYHWGNEEFCGHLKCILCPELFDCYGQLQASDDHTLEQRTWNAIFVAVFGVV